MQALRYLLSMFQLYQSHVCCLLLALFQSWRVAVSKAKPMIMFYSRYGFLYCNLHYNIRRSHIAKWCLAPDQLHGKKNWDGTVEENWTDIWPTPTEIFMEVFKFVYVGTAPSSRKGDQHMARFEQSNQIRRAYYTVWSCRMYREWAPWNDQWPWQVD